MQYGLRRPGTPIAITPSMHVGARRFASLVLAGAAACAAVTCGHDAPAVVPPREVAPLGPRTSRPSGPVGTTPVAALDRDADPASVAPRQPVLDAGVDGGAPLPPVPDASQPIVRDAGTPMR